jgi:triosephosphate isomerase
MTADEFGICVSLIRDLAHVHCSILYGGSVTPQTASAYVYAGGDGVLVGGASQCIDSCKALIQTLNTAYRTV